MLPAGIITKPEHIPDLCDALFEVLEKQQTNDLDSQKSLFQV